MPGPTGLECWQALSEHVESRVIILTMRDDADLATRAIRASASGFLLEESAGEELLAAMHQALQGRIYLTPAVTRDVMERMAAPTGALEPQLTPRQRDVLRLIVKGQRMKEIAGNLGLSTRTVETHKYEMMETLGLHSTAELVKYALDRRVLVAMEHQSTGRIWFSVVFRNRSRTLFGPHVPATPPFSPDGTAARLRLPGS